MHKIEISEAANEEFSDIYHYTVLTFGEKQYEIYEGKFKSAFLKIRNMPTIGHSRPDLPSEYLCYNMEQHAIIYKVNEANKSISILRVIHTKANFNEQF